MGSALSDVALDQPRNRRDVSIPRILCCLGVAILAGSLNDTEHRWLDMSTSQKWKIAFVRLDRQSCKRRPCEQRQGKQENTNCSLRLQHEFKSSRIALTRSENAEPATRGLGGSRRFTDDQVGTHGELRPFCVSVDRLQERVARQAS
jgi:hypothetical protein